MANPVALSPVLRLLVRRKRRDYTQPVRVLPSVLALLLQHRNAVPPPVGTVDDLLSALIQYLRSEPTVAAVLPVDKQGRVQVYSEMAPVGTVRPYVVLMDYTEESQGETIEDEPVQVTVEVYSEGMDQARVVGRVAKNAIDHKNDNANSLKRPLFAWPDGVETYCLRGGSAPRRTNGVGAGGKYVYCEKIAYVFTVNAAN